MNPNVATHVTAVDRSTENDTTEGIMPGILARIWHTCVPAWAIPICICTYLFQMAIYDYYLIVFSDYYQQGYVPELSNTTDSRNGGSFNPWYLMVIPDVIVLALFIVAFVKCHQHFTKKTESGQDGGSPVGVGGELPFGYITWFFYSLLNAMKVGIIFRWIAPILSKDELFGVNMVKTVVSLSCIVFITLVLNHHNAESGSARETFINFLAHSVTMDVLDTTEILQVLIYKESGVVLSYMLHKAVIAIACCNLILPTILMVALSKSRFGRDVVWMKRTQALHKILHSILVNLPLLVLRVILWHVHKQTVSVFIVKNCLQLGIMVRTIHLQVVGAVAAAEHPDGGTEEVEMMAITAPEPSPAKDEPVLPSGDGNEEMPAVEIRQPQPFV